MRTMLASRGLALTSAAVFAVAAPFAVALAQVGELPAGVTEAQAESALQDLSKIYGRPIPGRPELSGRGAHDLLVDRQISGGDGG